jgi:carboxynorspermidine decarboxylase
MQQRPSSRLVASQIDAPAFVIEEHIFRHNLSVLKEIHDATGATILHALKAWSPWQLFPIEREYIQGAEVSSLNEARLAYEHFGENVHMFAPAYNPEEFPEILKYCSTIIFNSFSQWEQYKEQAIHFTQTTGASRDFGLRINPEILDADGHGELWNPCAPGSRLGIRISEFRQALQDNADALDGITGLHFHLFFEKDAQDLADALTKIEANFGKYFSAMKWVNFGGGQKITDDSYDRKMLIDVLKAFSSKYTVDIHLEPGAALAWHVGTLVARVLDIVERDDVAYKIPILNISFENHLTDFFVSKDLHLDIRGAQRVDPEALNLQLPNLYRFGGSTCIAGDMTHALYSFEQPLKIGDAVVFEHAIQYTLIKVTMFNGVQHPSIVFLREDGKLETLRRFTYEDFKLRMG